ncbi:MAG: hypothetical protein JXB60_07850, partial [Candidatus Cloacimonetes bacterium]|nr:hypothetical protein [Candidatus Cloacimonadota bacterium]
ISRRINTGRSIDGLKMIDKDLFLISDWAGRTALVNTDGDILELLDTRAQNINAADLEYLSVTGTILIPTFFANKITAFRLLRSQNN